MPIKETEPELWKAALAGFIGASITALLRYILIGTERSWKRIVAGAILSGVAAVIAATLILRFTTVTELELIAISSFLGYLGAETVMSTLYYIAQKKIGGDK